MDELKLYKKNPDHIFEWASISVYKNQGFYSKKLTTQFRQFCLCQPILTILLEESDKHKWIMDSKVRPQLNKFSKV